MLMDTTVASPSPSIVVVQGAYDSFFSPDGGELVYSQGDEQRERELYSDLGARLFEVVQPTSLAVNDQFDAWSSFQSLVREWKAQRGPTSSITEAVLCPAYQRIIGMGKMTVPLILRQLRTEGSNPDQWFWALRAITGANPVDDADHGDYVGMARAWLEWGEHEA